MSRSPYHLTTVASTSIFKRRAEGGETAYCGTKAAQAAFTAAHAIEMSRALPGSAALLVNPGRMRSGQQDPAKAGKHLDVGVVAQRIWHEIDGQAASYLEMNIWPDGNGDPCVTYGPEMPQRY